MRAGALAFSAGVLLFHGVVAAPYTGWLPAVLGLAAAALLCCRPPPIHWLAWSLVGFAWTAFQIEHLMDRQLDLPAGAHADVVLDVRIADIPHRDAQRTVFYAIPLASPDEWGLENPPRQLRLAWYGPAPRLSPGEEWRLPLRLRPPDGFLNPGGFDYQRWLFVRRAGATGYVRTGRSVATPEWLGETASFHRVRERIARAVEHRMEGSPRTGLVQGLAVAVRTGISDDQWQVLSRTGTGHLLAISGLHVGLVAGMAGGAVALGWRLFPFLIRATPATVAGGLAALGAASIYAVLAGFTLPTQRALVMLTVFVTALLLRRSSHGWHSWAVAAAAVLGLDPMAPLEAGFWLSFTAVATILLGIQYHSPTRPRLWAWLRLQCVISLALLPLLALWFGEVPWVSPPANIVAIPVVGFAVVPPVLLGVALLPLSETLAGLCWHLADWVLALLWHFLAPAAEWTEAGSPGGRFPAWLLWASGIGAWLTLMPRGWPARLVCVPLLAALAFPPVDPPPAGPRVTLFDTRGGITALVVSDGVAVVYGLGPGGGLNGVRIALEPYWSRRGGVPDLAVVPRQDAFWSGGLATFETLWPDVPIYRGEGECRDPPPLDLGEVEWIATAGGCGMRITGPGGVVDLLPVEPAPGDPSVRRWIVAPMAQADGGITGTVRRPDGCIGTTAAHGAVTLDLSIGPPGVETWRARTGRPFHRHWQANPSGWSCR